MRHYLLIGATIALLAVPALAFGGTTTVTVAPNNTFKFGPTSVTKTVGTGGIHWQWGTSGTTAIAHNVRQDSKLFYSGTPTNSDPGGFSVVPSAGSFHYYCELHGSATGGMAGTIKIRPLTNKPPTAGPFGVTWAPTSSNTGGKFDVRYRVDGGTWRVWRNDTTARQATFGLNGNPVTVRAGHIYDVQVRSEKSTDTTKVSGWSPFARVTF